jgi:exonuclease SbcC
VALGENGIPTMDFLVQDSHHADRERPLTTLSGGETFLVSLALALALADFRAVRMPIETVLIDEGFGTLDPVTLNVVVQALENLQTSTGARVGIISHVSGLAERIGGRVLVERIAAGRSRIVVEVSA